MSSGSGTSVSIIVVVEIVATAETRHYKMIDTFATLANWNQIVPKCRGFCQFLFFFF